MVQYKYAEWLHSSFYDENPMPLLYVRNKSKEEILNRFTNGFDFVHDDEPGFA